MSFMDSAKSLGGDVLTNLTGNIDKACIIVHDVKEAAKKLELEQVPDSKLGSVIGNVANSTDGIAQMAQEALSEALVEKLAVTPSEDKIFYVQFNPSSIELFSSTASEDRPDPKTESDEEKKVDVNGDAGDKNTAHGSVVPPLAEMTTTLIFDQVNVYDSFMFDKLNGLNVSTFTNAAAGLAKTYSVQPYVEGFISAMRNEATRMMTFHWADFSFSGFLEGISATYTMFSLSGHPVRAVVQLRMRQNQHSVERAKWRKDFDDMFKLKGGIASKSLTTAGQKVSSLFNLSL